MKIKTKEDLIGHIKAEIANLGVKTLEYQFEARKCAHEENAHYYEGKADTYAALSEQLVEFVNFIEKKAGDNIFNQMFYLEGAVQAVSTYRQNLERIIEKIKELYNEQ